MKLVTTVLELPRTLVLGPWAWLWVWTYPLSKAAVSEFKANSSGVSPVNFIGIVRLLFQLPLMARSQHYAERSGETASLIDIDQGNAARAHLAHVQRWIREPLWRTRLRELLVSATLVSWFIGWSSINASVIFTGNFLFETHETPAAAGYVSNYFKVAALAFAVPFAWVAAGLATLGVTRRSA